MTRMEMGLRNTDFELTDAELERINVYFSERTAAHAAEGEDAPAAVSVTFDFMPGFGRMVTARFDGGRSEMVITRS